MARIRQTEVVGVDPVTMLKGPIPATEQVLEKADMTVVGDIDLFEVNEAFASVVGAWLEESGASWEDVNVNGGAIAHGHPLGATRRDVADQTRPRTRANGQGHRAVDDVYRIRPGCRNYHRTGLNRVRTAPSFQLTFT